MEIVESERFLVGTVERQLVAERDFFRAVFHQQTTSRQGDGGMNNGGQPLRNSADVLVGRIDEIHFRGDEFPFDQLPDSADLVEEFRQFAANHGILIAFTEIHAGYGAGKRFIRWCRRSG
ncbi:MAG: hypothetical protein C4527_03685 [Candidatus Omnitrophota bacterium]|nr:MAG: hypothetical protein C4527_03685 [Candidatus Omnitrophota bacterium]